MALNTKIRGLQINDNFFGAALKRNGTNGNIMDVAVDDASIEVSSDALQLKDSGVSTAKLADDSVTKAKINADIAGSGLVQAVGGELDVNVDNSTLEIVTDTVQVKDSGITTAKLANDAVTAAKLDETDTYDFTSGIVRVATPISNTDAANKIYVDGVVNGLDWKQSVRAATTASIADLSNASVIQDGVTLVQGNRLLVKNGASADGIEAVSNKRNGIYVVGVVASGGVAPLTRAADADENSEVTANLAVFAEEGTDNADTGWVLTTDNPITLDTTNLTFTQFTSLGQIVAGQGLSKTGNTLDVNVDGTTIEIVADTLRVKDAGISTAKIADDAVTKAKINADVAGNGLGQNVDGSLEVNVDNSSIEIATDTLRVKAGGITDTMLANDYIQTSEVDNVTIEFISNALRVKDAGISTAKLADGAVTNVKIADDTIKEAKLNVTNSPTDGFVLSYNAAGQNFTWISGTADAINEGDVVKENKSAEADGVQTAYVLANTPLSASLQVYLNGLLQEEGSGKDYTVSGSTVTFSQAPISGDIVIFHYFINN